MWKYLFVVALLIGSASAADKIEFIDPNTVLIDGEPYYLVGVITHGLTPDTEARVMAEVVQMRPTGYFIIDDEVILTKNGEPINEKIQALCEMYGAKVANREG
jgi:hypothetical protein